MGIKLFIINFINSKKIKGSFLDKISAFLTLNRLLIKRKLSPSKNTIVQERFFGFKFKGFDYSTIDYLFNEIFILNEYFFTPNTNAPIIIDCGSNIGMSVLYFKRLYPSSNIIAFEANPYAYKLLVENLTINNINDVALHNIALYNCETEISFFIGDNLGTLLGSLNSTRGGCKEIKMNTKKLSDYLKNFESIDLIKMDVEGAEDYIVDDLINSSAINKVKEFIIEYHHNMNGDKSNLSAFLLKFELNGFSYNIKSEYERINTFQDLRIHFYKKNT